MDALQLAALTGQLERQNGLLVLGQAALQAGWALQAAADLARLPFQRVLSLGQAPELIQAWRRAGRQVDEYALDGRAPPNRPGRITWLALPDAADDGPAWLAPLLRTWFVAHTTCFLNCSLQEPVIARRFWEMKTPVIAYRPRSWAIVPESIPHRQDWEDRGVNVLVVDPAAWAAELQVAWAAVAARDEQARSSPALVAERPYPFLDAFTEEDAGRFYGRSAAARNLTELVLTERITLCFGPSGVGKSSLLQAGLLPLLRQNGCLPLYCRPENDPLSSIRQAALRQEAAVQTSAASLPELLAALAQATQRSVVIVLDQFEEVFTLLGTETPERLAHELAACLQRSDLPLQIVFSLREDYLARMSALRPHLPAVFAHRFRLRPLSGSEAAAAITRPAEPFGMRYAPELVTRLLADLGESNDHVPPADLQIVCDALYRDWLDRQDQMVHLVDYERLGGRAELLGGYLERVVAQEPDPNAVRAVLKGLITAGGTRVVLPAADIAHLADLSPETAVDILQRLDRPHRLVRMRDRAGVPVYELAHEVLGLRILAWIQDPQEKAAKETQDLVRIELDNWQRFETLPGPGKLTAVYAQRANPYLRLRQPELELLGRGAVRHGIEPAYWLQRAAGAGVLSDDFLRSALDSPEEGVRVRAAELLGEERATAVLAGIASAADPAARERAVTTLAGLSHMGAWRTLKRARHDRAESVRLAAWDGLTGLKPAAAARLRRRDEVVPPLAAGSLVYWVAIVLAWFNVSPALSNPTWWAAVGGVWLAAVVAGGWLLPWLPFRSGAEELLLRDEGAAHSRLRSAFWLLLQLGIWLVAAWLLVSTWGWWRGGLAWLVLLWGVRGRVHLALVWLLAYLPLFAGVIPDTPDAVLAITSLALLAAALITLLVPRWGRFGADRPDSVVMLGGGAGALLGVLLAGLGSGGTAVGWQVALSLGVMLALGRCWARQPSAYVGGSDLLSVVADIGRALWDWLDQISLQLKPWVGGMVMAVWAAVIVQAATILAPGSSAAWRIGDSVWLAGLVGLGLWLGARNRWLSLLLPVLGGAAGGWLAQGPGAALVGAGIGAGLGMGEWLVARLPGSSAH